MAKAKVVKINPLEALLEDATTVETKKPSKAKEKRNVITLDGEKANAFDTFCMADAALKMAKGHQESAKGVILPVLTDDVLQMWCKDGARGENPRIQTTNGQAVIQIRENLKFELGEDQTPAGLLESVGTDAAKAAAIVEQEFTTTTELRFGNISALMNDPEKEPVVKKLLKMVLEKFTPEERKVLLEKVTKVEVNKGFLDRAVTHADRDPVMLKALFSVVKPGYLFSGIVWNGELSDAVKTLEGKPKTEKIASSIPTVEVPVATKIYDSGDNQWRAKQSGNVAKLFMMNGDAEVEMATKSCDGGAEHAQRTCEKWMRDPAYRAETMQKSK
jgi:sulfur carrier protein ThiS